MPQDTTISFRDQLCGKLVDFLEDEGMECSDTGKALAELVVALSRYQEEGALLFPKVLICDDLSHALRLLQAGDHLQIGVGAKGSATMRQALKRCAPLARDGWIVYLHRDGMQFRFGVLRAPASPVSLDLKDSIGLAGSEGRIILAAQLGDKAVEVIGGRGSRLVVHLSAAKTDQPSPRAAVENLAKAASRLSEANLKEPLESFLRSSLSSSLQRGHGALVAVLNDDGRVPKDWTDGEGQIDGVQLTSPLSLAAAVGTHATDASADSVARLMGYSQLLEGMLSADGITLLGPNGTIHGYNLFIKTRVDEGVPASSLVGGARRRAFLALRALVDEHHLSAAFFRSADGTSEFHPGSTST